MTASKRFFRSALQAALDGLPEEYQRALEEIRVVIEDVPEDGSAETLGLYEGTPLPERAGGYQGALPDAIYLYEKNIEAVCRSKKELAKEIRATLIHELGHHFGFNDDALLDAGY